MEEKNTNVSQTEENPEQNSPEISAESESITESAKDGVKTAVPKWLIIIIVAMAAVIIGLSVTLAVILAGGKTVDESSSSITCLPALRENLDPPAPGGFFAP